MACPPVLDPTRTLVDKPPVPPGRLVVRRLGVLGRRSAMSPRRRVTVTKEREVITYTELWHTSWCLLEKGQKQELGSFHQFMGSLVFTAFTLEAYLNHVGPKVFDDWDTHERLGPREKLDAIAKKIGL